LCCFHEVTHPIGGVQTRLTVEPERTNVLGAASGFRFVDDAG
jgi:hypothetical protein